VSVAVQSELEAEVARLTFTSTPVPTISGSAVIGQALTAAVGTWVPQPISLSCQWSAGGSAISGATSATYTIASADVGKCVTVAATGSTDAYLRVTQTSAATVTVAADTLSFLTARVPTISGTAKIGLTLTAVPGAWIPSATTISYQWSLDGTLVSGATA
jgi:hypothetical protein